jgi:hypothetical protein
MSSTDKLNTLPKRVRPKAETEEPRCRNCLRESELPKCITSITERDTPIRADPSTESDDDKRANCRIDSALPICKQSMTAKADPKRVTP